MNRMNRIAISQIVIDAGTQIRAAIDESTVASYAERMTEGDQFPPVVLFHDGNQHYLADGFHRVMAAQRIQWREIDADVQPGTKTDALWFGLGANKTNAHEMTVADKTNAVILAAETFHQLKTQKQIAEQIGCSQGFVSQVISANNLSYRSPQRITPEKIEAIKAMVLDGKSQTVIAKTLHAGTRAISRARQSLGLSKIIEATNLHDGRKLDTSKDGIQQRRERMRTMAAEGYTSRQIAASLRISEAGCRQTLRDESIDVPADRVVGKAKHHNSTRIIEHIVMDAETLTADVNLIDFNELDPDRIGEWADSLIASRKALETFIRRLLKEKSTHVEVA